MKLMWMLIFILIVFIDRNNQVMVIVTIFLLLLLTLITILRSLISRNEWRKLIKDGDVEIKEKIKF